jgi:hypothetical protein
MGILKRGARAASQEDEQQTKGSWWRDHRGTPRTRSVVVATGVLAVAITPFALAATGSNLREGLRNGTATSETQIISNVNANGGRTGGYSTRQSNLSASGGGAVYGCRSAAGTSLSTPPQNPCIRANNLSTGQAFEFNATQGAQGGSITVGTGGDTKKPFVTNATGVATGLNADRVDGKQAADFAAASDLGFAAIPAAGTSVTAGKGATSVSRSGTGPFDYAVVFNRDVSACSFTATAVGAPAALGVTPPVAATPNTVTVTATAATAFHLQVIC